MWSVRFSHKTGNPFVIEGVNGLSDTLVTASQFRPDVLRDFPLSARKEYLATPHRKGVGGPKAPGQR